MRLFLATLLALLASPTLQALPVLGFVPDKGTTLGPTLSTQDDTTRLGAEAALARSIFWASLSADTALGDDLHLGLEAGISLIALNIGLGYRLQLGDAAKHSASLILGIPIPLSDPSLDGKKFWNGSPILEPYVRFQNDQAAELGISLKLWWRQNKNP